MVVAVVFAFGLGSTSSSAHAAGDVAAESVGAVASPSLLAEDAETVAAQFGDSSPVDIQAIYGLRRDEVISKIMNISVQDGEAHVVMIQEHGSFTTPSEPRGAEAPTGGMLTIIVNEETGRITDISMAESSGDEVREDIESMGAGSPIALP